jgi:hypothetical protein
MPEILFTKKKRKEKKRKEKKKNYPPHCWSAISAACLIAARAFYRVGHIHFSTTWRCDSVFHSAASLSFVLLVRQKDNQSLGRIIR